MQLRSFLVFLIIQFALLITHLEDDGDDVVVVIIRSIVVVSDNDGGSDDDDDYDDPVSVSMRRSTIFPLISLLILLIGVIICFVGHCNHKRKVLTFVAGILFVVGGK